MGTPAGKCIKGPRRRRCRLRGRQGPAQSSKRVDLERLSGQRLYPVIEFEDGSVYREQSKDMAARIKGGKLMDAHTAPPSRSKAHAGPGESSGERANASEDQGSSDPAS